MAVVVRVKCFYYLEAGGGGSFRQRRCGRGSRSVAWAGKVGKDDSEEKRVPTKARPYMSAAGKKLRGFSTTKKPPSSIARLLTYVPSYPYSERERETMRGRGREVGERGDERCNEMKWTVFI